MTYRQVLVPVDFSDDSLSAYQVALDHFASPEASLVLLHVIEQSELDIHQDQHLRTQFIEAKKRQLATLGNGRRSDWKEVSTLVESGKPTATIISIARQITADVVVMGSHGQSSLTKRLFGSTTYDVARELKCSVMISKRS
jgi:nucleotide-binding universal stress UspA family protein